MALHADAQRAALASGELRQAVLCVKELRHHPIGQAQKVLPGLRRAQAAAFPPPYRHAQMLLQFADAVAERRLRQMQRLGGGRERALLVDGADDLQVDAFDDGHGSPSPKYELYSCNHENISFCFMYARAV